MEKAILVGRVSTKKQEEGTSLSNQLEKLIAYCGEKDYRIVGDHFVHPVLANLTTLEETPDAIPAYLDKYTGTTESRPELDAAWDFARRSGVTVMVVPVMNRFVRGGPTVMEAIERNFAKIGVRTEYVQGNYQKGAIGRFQKQMEASVSQLEHGFIVERGMKGRFDTALGRGKRGGGAPKVPCGEPPYGMEHAAKWLGGMGPGEHANVVEMIYNWYDNNVSVRGAVKKLFDHGIPSPSGAPQWRPCTVRKILRNASYAGEFRISLAKSPDDDRVDFVVPISPVVSREVFDRVQARLTDNKVRLRRQPAAEYTLRGRVRCSDCGYAYSVTTTTVKYKDVPKKYYYYRHKVSEGHCCNHDQPARELEDKVWQALYRWVTNADLRRASIEEEIKRVQEQHAVRYSMRETMQQQLVHYRKQRDHFTDLMLDAELMAQVGRETILIKLAEANDAIDAVSKSLVEIDAELGVLSDPGIHDVIDAFAAEMDRPDWTPAEIREVYEVLDVVAFIDRRGNVSARCRFASLVTDSAVDILAMASWKRIQNAQSAFTFNIPVAMAA
jgi:DNA invertase Pin-like site-specific DNA recombinase